jgi:hypothetical protein
MTSKHRAAAGLACLAFCANACAQSERIFLDDFDPPLALRVSDMDLRDPHVFINLLGCQDATDTPLAGFSVNGQWQTRIQTDGDGDGLLDRSDLLLIEPLDTLDAALGALDWLGADCTAPLAGTACSGNGSTPLLTTYMSQTSGTCLGTLAGTTRPYTPAVTVATAPCFVTPDNDIQIELFGTPVVLRDASIAATWVGSSTITLDRGLLRGFLTEADANATAIPASFPLIGGLPLSTLLPGGDPPGAGNTNCAAFSDLDVNDGAAGWWFYLNFSAVEVPYTP